MNVEIQDTTEVVARPLSANVCMHVLGTARTDMRVMRSATALVEAGCTVSIVDIESEASRSSEELFEGVHLKHLMMPASFGSTRFQRWTLLRALQLLLRAILCLMRTKADIYHAHDVSALPACYIAALLHRKKLVFDAHELPLADLPVAAMNASRRLLYKLFSLMLGLMLSRCAGVITVSPPIVQEMAKRYHIPPVTLVRNVPVYQAVAKSDRLRQHLGLDQHIRIALYQGNIQADRGLDKLVRAAPFLEPETVIVMMGKGAGKTPSELTSLIASEKVGDRVKILPPVPYAELLQWTASADIGLTIIPLDYTLNMRWSLPNKFFEYLMAGLPVLTSPLDAVSEVVTTCQVGQVVFSFVPQDIGAAINSLLADRDMLARMRSNALDAARQVFCWEQESPRLIHLYKKLSPPKTK